MFNSDELKQSILNMHNSYIQMLNSQDQLDYVANKNVLRELDDTISEADVINYEEDD